MGLEVVLLTYSERVNLVIDRYSSLTVLFVERQIDQKNSSNYCDSFNPYLVKITSKISFAWLDFTDKFFGFQS